MQEPTHCSRYATADTRRDMSEPPRPGAGYRRRLDCSACPIRGTVMLSPNIPQREGHAQQTGGGAEGLTPAPRPARRVSGPAVSDDAGADGNAERPQKKKKRSASSPPGRPSRIFRPWYKAETEQAADVQVPGTSVEGPIQATKEESGSQEPLEGDKRSHNCLTEGIKEASAPQEPHDADSSSRSCLTEGIKGASAFQEPHGADTSSRICLTEGIKGASASQEPHGADTSSRICLTEDLKGASAPQEPHDADTSSRICLTEGIKGASASQEPHGADTSSRICLTEDLKGASASQEPHGADTSSRNRLTERTIPHNADDIVYGNPMLPSMVSTQSPLVPWYYHLWSAWLQPPKVPDFTYRTGLEHLIPPEPQPSTSATSQPLLPLHRPHVQPPSWNKENLDLPTLPEPAQSQLHCGGQAGAFPVAKTPTFRQSAQQKTGAEMARDQVPENPPSGDRLARTLADIQAEARARTFALLGNGQPEPVASPAGQGRTRDFASVLHPNVTAGRPGLALTTKPARASSASDVQQYVLMQSDRLVCGVCGQSDFHNRALYYAHMQMHHLNKYRCDACGTHYRSASRLALHCKGAGHKAKIQAAESKDTRSFRCHFCQRGFIKPGMLHKHLRCKTHIAGLEQAGWLPIGTHAYLEGKDISGRHAIPGVLHVESTWENYIHLQELSKEMLADKPEKQAQWSKLYEDFLRGDLPERFPYELDEKLKENMSGEVVRPSFPKDFRPPEDAS